MTDAADDRYERLLDLFVYAPIGMASSLLESLPDLAESGRRSSAAARMVGRFALDGADQRIGERVEGHLTDARRHLDEFLRIVSSSSDRRVRGDSPDDDVVAGEQE